MDKRFFLALSLSAGVLLVTPYIFPRPERRTPAAGQGGGATTAARAAAARPVPVGGAAVQGPTIGAPAVAAADSMPMRAAVETTTVAAGRSTWRFVSPGVSPVAATLGGFPDLREKGAPVTLAAERSPLMGYRLVLGADTVPLAALPAQATAGRAPDGSPTLIYATSAAGRAVVLEHSFAPDSYLVRVRGRVEGAPAGAQLLVELPRGLRSHEADPAGDLRSLAFSYKPQRDDPQGIKFSDLDSGVTRVDAGPMKWVALRNKYFVTALIAGGASQFTQFRTTPAPEVQGIVREAAGVAVLPLDAGRFELTLLAAPQKARLLQAMGHDLINVNPYGGWLHGLVQPFASIVNNILLWLKDTTKLNYGWVLIIFGVLVRLLMWPLQQSAMRNSMKMQRLQPELQEIQKKYAREPEKQRDAIMKVYASHGMSPFSPMLGCLPMLLPMPVLFALYFVFQNTIEFRGVPFWWLQDISLKDPYYIIPVFMGLTMLLLSWIGMRGMPPNPQAKIMGYMMPAMMTVLFLNFPSGLNLYYAVQNVAAMPQQWLLSRERSKEAAKSGAVAAGPGVGGRASGVVKGRRA